MIVFCRLKKITEENIIKEGTTEGKEKIGHATQQSALFDLIITWPSTFSGCVKHVEVYQC